MVIAWFGLFGLPLAALFIMLLAVDDLWAGVEYDGERKGAGKTMRRVWTAIVIFAAFWILDGVYLWDHLHP